VPRLGDFQLLGDNGSIRGTLMAKRPGTVIPTGYDQEEVYFYKHNQELIKKLRMRRSKEQKPRPQAMEYNNKKAA